MNARSFLAACAALLLAEALVFGGSLRHDFVYDDTIYVTANEHVRLGLNADTFLWALTAREVGHWHPLTWLSHLLDVSLFGLGPAGHHATNLILHAGCTLLLFAFLLRATGAAARSFLVAAIFAIHPLRAESVAWVADRKDLLATFLALLTLEAWRRHMARPSPSRYAAAFLAFSLALLAKISVAILPFLLLLLDLWPLGPSRRPLREKLLFLIPAGPAIFFATRAFPESAVVEVPLSPQVWLRQFAGALVMMGDYVAKTVWPLRLAVLEPLPETLSAWGTAWRVGLFVAVTIFVTVTARRHRERAVGWGWFVLALLPVAGLVPGAPVLPADRYTYFPHAGLLILIVWCAADAWRRAGFRSGRLSAAAPALSALAVLLLATLCQRQVAVWHDEVALFRHAREVNGANVVAHQNLGFALVRRGEREEAVAVYEGAIARWPEVASLHLNLGALRMKQDRPEDAARHFRAALERDPDSAEAHFNLANALRALGRREEAERSYRRSLQLRPAFAECWNNLGTLLLETGRRDEAVHCFRESLRVNPRYGVASANLALLADPARTQPGGTAAP